MLRITVTLAIALTTLLIVSGCSPSEPAWQPDVEWRSEKITEESTSFLGSYQNALDTLRIRSHEWKLIECDKTKDRCEWGFKLVIEFPDHPDYTAMVDDDGKVLAVSIMPISRIEYRLFDADGFHLTTLTLTGDSLHVAEEETRTFQHTGFIATSMARRATHGKVTIKAGYVPQPAKP